jgi:hypothetical protein
LWLGPTEFVPERLNHLFDPLAISRADFALD